MTSEEAISVKGLVKLFRTVQKEKGLRGSLKALLRPKYKETMAVDHLGLRIGRGEAVAFIGPNGAGKSTTIKMLTGILYPTAGQIRVLGLDPAKERKKLAYRIGTVFGQRSSLWYHLPPLETYDLFASIYDLEEKEYRKRLERLVDIFGIREHLRTPVRKLSLGERMRAELVGALLHDPEVILLDEPTIGLDIVAKKQLRATIRRLNQEEGKTILLTSHDLDDVEEVCERVIIINHGKIIYDGSLASLRERYATRRLVKLTFGKKKGRTFTGEGAAIVDDGAFSTTYELDLKKTSAAHFIKDALAHHQDIADITITEMPIEEIIEGIYQRS